MKKRLWFTVCCLLLAVAVVAVAVVVAVAAAVAVAVAVAVVGNARIANSGCCCYYSRFADVSSCSSQQTTSKQ